MAPEPEVWKRMLHHKNSAANQSAITMQAKSNEEKVEKAISRQESVLP
jgi:hypothetical protein